MITTEIPTWEDSPAMPKSNYRASGLVLRHVADVHELPLPAVSALQIAALEALTCGLIMSAYLA